MTLHHSEQQGLAALERISVSDMRAWDGKPAQLRYWGPITCPQMSAVKSFYRWLAERKGVRTHGRAVHRAPKFTEKLPRPLTEDAARTMIGTVEMQSQLGLGRRKRCGRCNAALWLRIAYFRGTVFNRSGRPSARDSAHNGQGRQERIVPVIPVARLAVMLPETLSSPAIATAPLSAACVVVR